MDTFDSDCKRLSGLVDMYNAARSEAPFAGVLDVQPEVVVEVAMDRMGSAFLHYITAAAPPECVEAVLDIVVAAWCDGFTAGTFISRTPQGVDSKES